MVAFALMSPKPPTKRFSFRAPDSWEGNDFQIGRPPHQSGAGQALCVCVCLGAVWYYQTIIKFGTVDVAEKL